MSPPSILKTIAYLRKSRADGEESVEEVLAKHERMLQDYAVRTWNTELQEKQIFREVQSGETIASRPVMQHLIRMIQDGEVEAVLCVDLQRLSRGDLLDVGELSRLFTISGCVILTPNHFYNLCDEYDKKFFEMELMHGNDYLEYTKKIMGRGRKQSVLDGNYIGSVAPYGYDKVMVNKRPTLAVNPTEAEMVRLIFDLYTGSECLGPVLIADRLNRMGIPPRKYDRWTAQGVRNIVNNTVYIGKLTWGRRKTVKQYADGKIVESRPWSEDFVYVDGKHEPIIDMDTWNRAKQIASTRAHPSARHDRSRIVNPLSGLIVCAECGYMMSYKLCYDHKTKKPINPIFLCTTKGCATRGAPVYEVLKQLEDNLSSHLREIESAPDSRPESPGEKTLQLYENELEDLLRQREKLFDFLERGVYSEEDFIERSGKLNTRIESIRSSIADQKEKEATRKDAESFKSSLVKCIQTLRESTLPEEINPVLKTIITKIQYRRARTPDRSYTPISLSVFFN